MNNTLVRNRIPIAAGMTCTIYDTPDGGRLEVTTWPDDSCDQLGYPRGTVMVTIRDTVNGEAREARAEVSPELMRALAMTTPARYRVK